MSTVIELLSTQKKKAPLSTSVTIGTELPVLKKPHEGTCGDGCGCGAGDEGSCCG